ncbi:protein of unknown function [Agreia sp. COWG]|nr:protein of unknown function [Agreia sp. COWG]
MTPNTRVGSTTGSPVRDDMNLPRPPPHYRQSPEGRSRPTGEYGRDRPRARHREYLSSVAIVPIERSPLRRPNVGTPADTDEFAALGKPTQPGVRAHKQGPLASEEKRPVELYVVFDMPWGAFGRVRHGFTVPTRPLLWPPAERICGLFHCTRCSRGAVHPAPPSTTSALADRRARVLSSNAPGHTTALGDNTRVRRAPSKRSAAASGPSP